MYDLRENPAAKTYHGSGRVLLCHPRACLICTNLGAFPSAPREAPRKASESDARRHQLRITGAIEGGKDDRRRVGCLLYAQNWSPVSLRAAVLTPSRGVNTVRANNVRTTQERRGEGRGGRVRVRV